MYTMDVSLSLTNSNKVIFEIRIGSSYPLLHFYNSNYFMRIILEKPER